MNMHHLLKTGLLAAGLFAALSAGAQTTATGPYYATPSWDQQLPAAQRFVVLSNWGGNAVLDRETGLVWERDPQAAHAEYGLMQTYPSAFSLCTVSNTGGRKGWRLPSIHELSTLYDASGASSGWMLPIGHPFRNIATGAGSSYWTATQKPSEPSYAFTQNFTPGAAELLAPIGNMNGVWCVRGPGTSL